MSDQIDVAAKETWIDGFELLAQQLMPKTLDRITVVSKPGERTHVQQIGAVAAREKTGRHEDTQYIHTPHLRRWISHKRMYVSDLIELKDLIEVIDDPAGEYARNMVAAIWRDFDATVVTAALGTAYTGKDGTTPATLPGGQQIGAGGTGFTFDKVRETGQKLKAGHGVDMDPVMTIFWTSHQEEQFLDENEVKSVDYNTQRVLVKGGMDGDTFYGFNYVRMEDWTDENGVLHRILPKVSTTRTCVAALKSGLVANMQERPNVKIDQQSGKHYDWQVYACAQYGAVRRQDTHVVQIDVVES